MKLSIALAAFGLALLAASFAPWRSPAATTASPPAEPAAAQPAPSTGSGTGSGQGAGPADAAYGQALFMAKGCATCHHHTAVAQSGDFGGMWNAPDLSTFRWTEEYLHTWLKDPSAVKPGTQMPNLELKQDEIEALIAFLKEKG